MNLTNMKNENDIKQILIGRIVGIYEDPVTCTKIEELNAVIKTVVVIKGSLAHCYVQFPKVDQKLFRKVNISNV